jgi:hypothetical protein
VQLVRPSGALATLIGDVPERRPRPLPLPPHHDPEGGYRNVWPTADTREEGGFMRWQRERREKDLPRTPHRTSSRRQSRRSPTRARLPGAGRHRHPFRDAVGTFRPTDEDPLEPPVRVREVGKDIGLPAADLQILPHGGTWVG